jgi:hypothetical protein
MADKERKGNGYNEERQSERFARGIEQPQKHRKEIIHLKEPHGDKREGKRQHRAYQK